MLAFAAQHFHFKILAWKIQINRCSIVHHSMVAIEEVHPGQDPAAPGAVANQENNVENVRFIDFSFFS